MLKKEIKDTLKQTALVFSFMLLIPIIFGINNLRFPEEDLSFLWYIEWGVSYLISFLTLYLAYNMFASEDSDGALDYIRSLPVNKWKLLAIKILPRLAVTLLLVFAYRYQIEYRYTLGVAGISQSGMLLYHFSFLPNTGIFLMIMIAGFLLGISNRKNPFLVVALAMPVLYMILGKASLPGPMYRSIYYWWYGHFGYMSHNVYRSMMFLFTTFLQVYLPSILSFTVLIPVFNSWDCSSGRIRSQRILKRIAGPLGMIIALYTISNFRFL
ncbi:MAG: hypothetical protein KAR40_08425 [Candidatus Sabulitectum sp.]|nr:hypothetical protein [Candidatus Sabulitectum sp.]